MAIDDVGGLADYVLIRSVAPSIESWCALMGLEQAKLLQGVRFPQEDAPFAGLSARFPKSG